MGSSQSSEMKITAKAITDIATDISVKQVTRNENNCRIVQNIKANFGGGTCQVPTRFYGGISVGQRANNTCELTAQGVSQAKADIQNLIQNTLTTVTNQQQKAVQEFLTLAVSRQRTGMTTKQEIINNIKTNISQETLNSCINNADISQNQELTFCGEYFDKVDLSQNATQRAIANCVSSAIFDYIQSNKTLNTIYTQADQNLVAEQQGIFSIIDKIGGIYAIIAIVVILVLIVGGVIAFYVFKQSPAGKALGGKKK